MEFHEHLNTILKQYNISAKAVSELSGISTSAISRYRKGERKPDSTASKYILSAVLHLIEKQGATLTEQKQLDIQNALTIRESVFRTEHFDLLISKLSISMTELSGQINYSLPYLSSIRSGKNQPADRERFLEGLCAYLKMHRQREDDRRILQILTGSNDLTDLSAVMEQWLWGTDTRRQDGMGNFLHSLDSFDLNQYMTMFHFETPEIPKEFDTAQLCGEYVGTEQMRNAELNFFRMTLLSPSTEPIFMHNEMSLTDMAQDMEFNKNWMLSIALCLKKGLHLDMIHDLDRPAEEMLLGLMAWIPLYMTGQISPYYLKSASRSPYKNTLYLSGAASLTGTSVQHDDAWYSLTFTPELMRASALRKVNLMRSAAPLMDIYRQDTENKYQSFLHIEAQSEGKRLTLHPSLPFYTLSEELLTDILQRNVASDGDKEKLLRSLAEVRELSEDILSHSELTAVIPELSEEEYRTAPLHLALTDSFCDTDYAYTYEEYKAHLELTKTYAQAHGSLQLETKQSPLFRNIRIKCKLHEWVMISKSNAPTTHFVIRHPKLVAALENFCLGQIGFMA